MAQSPIHLPNGSDAGSSAAEVAAMASPHHPVRSTAPKVLRTITPLPAVLSSAPTPITLAAALRRRWLLAISLGLVLGGAAAAGVWFGLPQAKPVAVRKIFVSMQPSPILFPEAEPNFNADTFQRSQLALVRSRLVLMSALRKLPDLETLRKQPSAVEWLEKNVNVDFALSPEIMRISLTGDNSDDLIAIADAVTDAYLLEVVDEQTRQRESRLEVLKDIRNKSQQTLEERRKYVKEIASDLGTADPQALSIKQQLCLRQLSLATEEWTRITSIELPKLREELKIAEGKQKSVSAIAVPETAVEESLSKDPQIAEYQAKKAKLQEVLAQTIAMAAKGDAEPRVQDFRNAIRANDLLIEQRRKYLSPLANEQLRERFGANMKASVGALRERIAFYESMEKYRKSEIEAHSKEAKSLGQKGPELDFTIRDMSGVEETFSRASKAVNALEIENQNKIPRVRKMEDKAFVTVPNDTAKRAASSGLAGGAGLGFMMLLVSFIEFRSRKVSTTDEIVHGLGMPLMGTLPGVPVRKNRLLGNAGGVVWQSMLTESVDATRTMILHAAASEGLQVVMVTSAVGGEGKTSLSCHLAASLARSGRRTVLLDGDMRNPAAHRMFDLPVGPGFSEVLRGEVDLAQVVHATAAGTLLVVPAGKCDAAALHALAQGKAQPLFDRLRQDFDFVIVDSCPVLPVADALLVGQHVDAVVFSVLRDVSRMPKVYAAYQRLATLGLRMLGAVVNGTREESYGSNYRYLTPTMGK